MERLREGLAINPPETILIGQMNLRIEITGDDLCPNDLYIQKNPFSECSNSVPRTGLHKSNAYISSENQGPMSLRQNG
jgi:hypothetical protein